MPSVGEAVCVGACGHGQGAPCLSVVPARGRAAPRARKGTTAGSCEGGQGAARLAKILFPGDRTCGQP